jgi:hypothetical protein
MGSRLPASSLIALAVTGLVLAAASRAAAAADTLRATYALTLIGVPIGTAKVSADITPTSYVVDASARLSGVGAMFSNSRGASIGKGAIVSGHVSPASFATTASNASMTRTVRMALAGNAVARVDIEPPFEEKPDRIPLTEKDTQGVLDPVGAFVIPAPTDGPPTSPAACNRNIPVFDGYTRFDVTLTYVGQRKVVTKGYSGPVAVCAARYTPIAGHRRDRPATKFMADNKDIEVWLAPVGGKALWPYRISVRTLIGTAVAEATEFSVAAK